MRIRQVEEEEDEALVVAVCYIPPESPIVEGLAPRTRYNL